MTDEEEGLKEHTYKHHPEIIMVHTMAEQLNCLSENLSLFTNFQSSCEKSLNSILENQNALRQEIFLLKNQLHEQTNLRSHTPLSTVTTKTIHSSTQTDSSIDEKSSDIGKVPNPSHNASQKSLPTTMPQLPTKILHMSDARNLVDCKAIESSTGAMG